MIVRRHTQRNASKSVRRIPMETSTSTLSLEIASTIQLQAHLSLDLKLL
jgi:hypothetical protein